MFVNCRLIIVAIIVVNDNGIVIASMQKFFANDIDLGWRFDAKAYSTTGVGKNSYRDITIDDNGLAVKARENQHRTFGRLPVCSAFPAEHIGFSGRDPC